jgi:hypothetical protein
MQKIIGYIVIAILLLSEVSDHLKAKDILFIYANIISKESIKILQTFIHFVTNRKLNILVNNI